MFEFKNISKIINSRFGISEISFHLSTNESLAIVGPSGSGKTTLLRMILGLEAPTSGEIRLGDLCLSQGSKILVPTELRNFGMVFQEPFLFSHLDVFDNVALGLQGMPIPEQLEFISPWTKALHISDLLRRKIDGLSGGEKQRVALARALVTKPKLMLFDEAFNSLDCFGRSELLKETKSLLVSTNTPSIFVTHDLRDAMKFCDNILILRDGKCVQMGTTSELRAHPIDDWTKIFLESALS